MESRKSMSESGEESQKSYSPPFPLVPNPLPSRFLRATTSVRFSRRSPAAPPPWRSVDKSPSTLGHALSMALAVSPPSSILGERPVFAKPRPPQSPSRIQALLALPAPGMAFGRPRPRRSYPAFPRPSPGGAAQAARCPPECLSHTPPPPRAQAVPSRLRLRSEPEGLRRLRLREGSGVPDGRGRVWEAKRVSWRASWRRSKGRPPRPATGRPLGWKRRLLLHRRLRPRPRVRPLGLGPGPSPRGGSSGRCSSPRSTSSPFACSAATKQWKSSRRGSSQQGPGSSTPTATSGTGGPAERAGDTDPTFTGSHTGAGSAAPPSAVTSFPAQGSLGGARKAFPPT